MNYIDNLKSHSAENIPISNESLSYPVIIFAPGFGMPASLYSALHEELASHGYIVIAISFPYITNPVVFSDGKIIKEVKNIDKEKEFKIWLEDIKFVLDQLKKLNSEENILKGKLDLNKIGIYGHSFGGGVAIKISDIDKRITAGIDLDGKLRDEQEKLNKPFMFINSKQSEKDLEPLKNLNRKISTPGYFITIESINHGAFTDLFLLVKNCKNQPELNPIQAIKIIRNLITEFFNKYLKNKNIDLLSIINQIADKTPKINFEINESAHDE